MPGVFLLDEQTNTLRELEEAGYITEAQLQTLLASHSGLLVGGEIDPEIPRRWLLISRETAIPGSDSGSGRWYVDHLFIDQDSIPTLVEVKRSTDTRIRREVVGQLLEYAANAMSYWSVESIRASYVTECENRGVDSALLLQEFLQDISEESFWTQVKTNLQAGRIRLLFVADTIPRELQQIVEFLNRHMDPVEVLAIEIKRFAGDGVSTLVPRLIGQSVEAQQRKSGGTAVHRNWDEPRFMEELARQYGQANSDIARLLLRWAEARTEIWWGQGKSAGSFSPRVYAQGTKYQLFAVWTRGTVQLYFGAMNKKTAFVDSGLLDKLHARLEAAVGPLPSDQSWPSFSLAQLADPKKFEQFTSAFEWLIGEIQSA